MATTKKNSPPIICLTSDFGENDGYVGAMKGVILNICPTAILVDLSHTIPPQDIKTAAFVLYQAFNYYPPHTIHCVVVDPGVGSQRHPVAVRTNYGIFVGPDNGLFNLILTAKKTALIEAVILTNPDYHLPDISSTFHGRDIFAPVAAHIANGVPLAEFGPPAVNLTQLDIVLQSKNGLCQVIHIDRFGNLILNLTASDIVNMREITFNIGGKIIKSVSHTFSDVEKGQLLAYISSTKNHINIATRNGSIAQELGIKVGDIVRVNE